MRDVNGLLMAWYHPFDEKPLWEIPAPGRLRRRYRLDPARRA